MIPNPWHFPFASILALYLLVGPSFGDEGSDRQIDKAIRKYQRLLDEGHQEQAHKLAERTAKRYPNRPAAQLLKRHCQLYATPNESSVRLLPIGATEQANEAQNSLIVAKMLIVDVPETFFETLGLDFDFCSPTMTPPQSEPIGIDFDISDEPLAHSSEPLGIEVRTFPIPNPRSVQRIELGTGNAKDSYGILSQLEANLLQWAMVQGNGRILSRPMVRTLPRQPATVQVASDNGPNLSMNLRADVTENGKKFELEMEGRSLGQSTRVEAKLPLGKTLLISLGDHAIEARRVEANPMLSKVPYVNRLFKNTGVGREIRHRFVFITPEVVQEPKSYPIRAN